MSERRRLLLAAVIWGWAVLAVEGAAAQTPDADVRALKGYLDERVQIVEGWGRDAKITLVLTLAAALLGGAISALQGVKLAKAVAIAGGIAVSSITIIRMTAYDIDQRTLERACHRARRHLEDADFQLRQGLPSNFVHRQGFVDSFQRSLHEIDRIAEELTGKEPTQRAALSPPTAAGELLAALGLATAPAFAGESAPPAPSWVLEPPKSTAEARFFVASGVSSSLAEARELSRKSAAEEATGFLATEIEREVPDAAGIDAKDFAAFLAANLEEVRSAFTRDEKTGLYRYYTLVRVSGRDLASGPALYAIRQNVAVPATLGQSLSTAQEPLVGYQVRRDSTYATLLAHAMSTMPADELRHFEEARLRRQSGDPAGARVELSSLVAQHPDFYLAWFNLGLASDNLGDLTAARSAYLKALELEPAQPVRDASIYNTFGHFLYRQGENEASLGYFDKALDLMPDHPLAKTNRAAVIAKLEPDTPAVRKE